MQNLNRITQTVSQSHEKRIPRTHNQIALAVSNVFRGAKTLDIITKNLASQFFCPESMWDEFIHICDKFLNVHVKINVDNKVYCLVYQYDSRTKWTIDVHFNDDYDYLLSDVAKRLDVDEKDVVQPVLAELDALTYVDFFNIYKREIIFERAALEGVINDMRTVSQADSPKNGLSALLWNAYCMQFFVALLKDGEIFAYRESNDDEWLAPSFTQKNLSHCAKLST